MDKGQAIRRRAIRQLDLHGWRHIRSEVRSGSPWLTEVWTLESVWSPSGLRAYLVFLTNPHNLRLVTVHVSVTEPEPGWLPPARQDEDSPWAYGVYLPALERRDGHIRRPSSDIVNELAHWRDANLSPPSPTGDARAERELLERSCADAERQLHQFRYQLGDRRLRLFTCACLRHLPHVMEQASNRIAVEAAEEYADGLVPKQRMKKTRKAANMPWLTSFEAYHEAMSTLQMAALMTTAERQRGLNDLLSDVSGQVRQPVTLRPSWLRRNGGVVARMAQIIYADRTFEHLPILADALEETGCENPLILNHCRQPGEHVRGCWVLDLLLGKQ